jgi:hypothetical protein
MNVSIITSCSVWKVKWQANRTEADQGSKREGVYLLESEQFMWMYYQMHPLGGADCDSNGPGKQKTVKKLIDSMEKGRWHRDKP